MPRSFIPACVLLATVCAACAAKVTAPNVPDAEERAAPGEEIDWGAKLFPDGIPSITQEKPAAQPSPPEAPPPPSYFAQSSYAAWDDQTTERYESAAAFCAAANAWPPAEADGITASARTCKEIPLGVSFRGDGETYTRKSVAVRVFDGVSSYSTLLLGTSLGLVPMPMAWDADDPRDPGCPSIVRLVGLERLTIEQGLVVIIALGEDRVMGEPVDDQDGGWRRRLLPVVVLAKLDGEEMHTRRFEKWGGPWLGEKVQPGRIAIPWRSIPWSGRPPIKVRADGTLDIPEPEIEPVSG